MGSLQIHKIIEDSKNNILDIQKDKDLIRFLNTRERIISEYRTIRDYTSIRNTTSFVQRILDLNNQNISINRLNNDKLNSTLLNSYLVQVVQMSENIDLWCNTNEQYFIHLLNQYELNLNKISNNFSYLKSYHTKMVFKYKSK